jgi:hypothetical protein
MNAQAIYCLKSNASYLLAPLNLYLENQIKMSCLNNYIATTVLPNFFRTRFRIEAGRTVWVRYGTGTEEIWKNRSILKELYRLCWFQGFSL